MCQGCWTIDGYCIFSRCKTNSHLTFWMRWYDPVFLFFLSYQHYCLLLLKNPNAIFFDNVGNHRWTQGKASIRIHRFCNNWCIIDSHLTIHHIICVTDEHTAPFKKAKCWNSVCNHWDVVSLLHILLWYVMKQCIKGAPSVSFVPLYHTHWPQLVHVCHHSNAK